MVDLPAFLPDLSNSVRVIFFWATIWRSGRSQRGRLLPPGDPVPLSPHPGGLVSPNLLRRVLCLRGLAVTRPRPSRGTLGHRSFLLLGLTLPPRHHMGPCRPRVRGGN